MFLLELFEINIDSWFQTWKSACVLNLSQIGWKPQTICYKQTSKPTYRHKMCNTASHQKLHTYVCTFMYKFRVTYTLGLRNQFSSADYFQCLWMFFNPYFTFVIQWFFLKKLYNPLHAHIHSNWWSIRYFKPIRFRRHFHDLLHLRC